MEWSAKRERVYGAERSGVECAGAERLRNGMKAGVKQAPGAAACPCFLECHAKIHSER